MRLNRNSGWLLATALLLLPAPMLLADGTTEIAPSEIERLIAELGADRYLVRQVATARLTEIGSAARPLLEEAAVSSDAEVRKRAKHVLEEVIAAEFSAQLRAFVADVDGRNNVSLPAWDKFRERFGEEMADRDVFVAMHRSEPELMRAYDKGPGHAVVQLDRVCADTTAKTAMRGSGIVQPIEIGTVASVLLVTSDPEINCSSQTLRSIYSQVYQQPFLTAIQSPQSSQQLRELLGAWIQRNTTADSPASYQYLQLALRFQLEAGLQPALELIKRPSVPAPSLLYAIVTVGRFGDEQHIAALAPLLENESDCARASIREEVDGKRKTRQIPIQVRDLALGMMIQLAGEEHSDYGYPAARAHSYYSLTPQSLYFPSNKEREEALAMWEKKHGQESPSKKPAEPAESSAEPSDGDQGEATE